MRRGGWLAAIVSAVLFGAAFYLRMNWAYGPLHLGLDPSDWTVLWELLRYGQIAAGVVVQSAVLGVAAALLPWLVRHLLTRAARSRR